MSNLFEINVDRVRLTQAPVDGNEATRKDYVDQKITDLVNGAPGILDTLKEISDALGNDANLAVSLTNLINQSINTEQTARAIEDARLNNMIDGEATQRNFICKGLASDITNVGNALSSEVSRATASEATLDAKIDSSVLNEANRAIGAEADLDAKVSSEVSRATVAEVDLDIKISTEVSRATASEASLDSKIDSVLSQAVAGLDGESLRAITAENLLQANLNNEQMRAENAEGSKLDIGPIFYNRDPMDFHVVDIHCQYPFKIASYLALGDRWRISFNTSDSDQKRLSFEYKQNVDDEGSWVVGIPFISTPL